MGLIKTATQIDKLRLAGKFLSKVFDKVGTLITEGALPINIDKIVKSEITKYNSTPSFLNYCGFPNSSCISVNDQVVHTIPGTIPLVKGDIVTVDIGLKYIDVYVDAARTYLVENVSAEARRLVETTHKALLAGILQVKSGNKVGMISHAIQKVADKEKLGIVRAYTGHGVGTAVHEEPSIPNYGQPVDGIKLKEGMVLAIEPMFTLGGVEVLTLSDGWTVITNDNTLAAQIEHTVLVTKEGSEILV